MVRWLILTILVPICVLHTRMNALKPIQLPAREVPGSNLGRKTGYRTRELFWFFSVPSGRFQFLFINFFFPFTSYPYCLLLSSHIPLILFVRPSFALYTDLLLATFTTVTNDAFQSSWVRQFPFLNHSHISSCMFCPHVPSLLFTITVRCEIPFWALPSFSTAVTHLTL
jgi:hypothetical protein